MRIAVIGAGNWGKNHVKTAHALGMLDSVAEMAPALRQAVIRDYPAVQVHEDYAPILSDQGIAAVVIATPAHTHHAIAREALMAGKDVFVEKPLTLSVSEGEDLVELARRQARILMVGHLLLYQPAVAWVRDFIAAGSLGDVYSLHQERLNLGIARSVENALWSLGVHDVAVLLHLVGEEPDDVQVVGQRVLTEAVEDDVTLHLTFPSGTQAHLHTSWLWPEKRRRLSVIGSAGMLVYDELEQRVTLHRQGIDASLKVWNHGSSEAFQGQAEPLRLEMEHFLECITTRRPPRSDGASSLPVLRVLERAGELLAQRSTHLQKGPSRWQRKAS